jgi:catechol 2,3-dioxygenase-like lactoylglutathione lyase family enzyme
MATQEKLGSAVICQIAIVVRDIEKTARAYADLFGVEVPKWNLTATVDQTHAQYRGEPTEGRAKLAFFRLGETALELIEPVGGPSTWQEHLETRGEGVHHIAFRIKGMDEQVAFMEGKGMPLVQKGDFKKGCYAYLDSAPRLGVMLELLESFNR